MDILARYDDLHLAPDFWYKFPLWMLTNGYQYTSVKEVMLMQNDLFLTLNLLF